MTCTCEERKDGIGESSMGGEGQRKPDHTHAQLPMPGTSALFVLTLALQAPVDLDIYQSSYMVDYQHHGKRKNSSISSQEVRHALHHLPFICPLTSSFHFHTHVDFRGTCLGQSPMPGGLIVRGLFCIGVVKMYTGRTYRRV